MSPFSWQRVGKTEFWRSQQNGMFCLRKTFDDLKLQCFNNYKTLVCADELTDAFYDAMGPDEEAEESNTSSEDDSEASEKPELFHVSDESGEMQIEKIGEGSFEQDTLLDKVMLNAHDKVCTQA